jgi:hypothetical protein
VICHPRRYGGLSKGGNPKIGMRGGSGISTYRLLRLRPLKVEEQVVIEFIMEDLELFERRWG